MLLVTGLSLYVLFPSLVSVFSSWRTLSTIDWFWAQLMVMAEALSFVAIWRLQRIALQERTRGAAEDVTRVARLRLCGALLGMIPLTPGGLGFVEAGIVRRSRSRAGGAAVTATLRYRLVAFWLPIPIGGVAYLLFRRRYGATTPRTATQQVPHRSA